MQAVILAGGKGTRMLPLSVTRPKSLIPLMNKTLIEHTISSLQGSIEEFEKSYENSQTPHKSALNIEAKKDYSNHSIDEILIVYSFFSEKIIDHLGDNYDGIKINYVEQSKLNGTGSALLCAEEYLQDRFCLIPTDDLYSEKDITECLKYESAVLAKTVENPERFGILKVENCLVKEIEEKPLLPESNLASTMFFVFNKKIVEILKKTSSDINGELDLTTAVQKYVQKEKMNCVVSKDYWQPLAYPWDLLKGMDLLFSKTNGMRPEYYYQFCSGGVYVTPGSKIILGKNTKIKPGTVIEGNLFAGENCVIGPHAYLRGNVCLGNNCHVGRAEIKNSILFDGVKAHHTCEILDSIIGENCNIAAQTVTANKRIDNKTVKSLYDGKLVDTGLRKFGTVMGDNSQTTCGTVINPGIKYWPNEVNKEKNVARDIK